MYGFSEHLQSQYNDKENTPKEEMEKSDSFDIEARRAQIFERLFSKSSELTSVTTDMFNLTSNLETRGNVLQSIENFDSAKQPTKAKGHSMKLHEHRAPLFQARDGNVQGKELEC